MKIDINNLESLKTLTLQDLIDDAVERRDVNALNWLNEVSAKTETRKRNDVEYSVKKPIVSIRSEYLKTYLNYKPKSEESRKKAKENKRKSEEEKRIEMFAKAFEAIKG